MSHFKGDFFPLLYVAGTTRNILIKGGVLILGGNLIYIYVHFSIYVAGTMHGVLFKGIVLISGVISCTYLHSWTMQIKQVVFLFLGRDF